MMREHKKKFKEYETPKNECPMCHYVMDMASCIDFDKPASPRPGDVGICLNCGEIMVFDENLQFRFPTGDEAKQAEENAGVKLTQAYIKERGKIKNG